MKNYDIPRLGKIVTLISKIQEIFCQMDEKEYKRMRDYISSRFDTSFPYSNPMDRGEEINTK